MKVKKCSGTCNTSTKLSLHIATHVICMSACAHIYPVHLHSLQRLPACPLKLLHLYFMDYPLVQLRKKLKEQSLFVGITPWAINDLGTDFFSISRALIVKGER